MKDNSLPGHDHPMKPLFSEQKAPMLLASLADPTPGKTISSIRNAIYDGADGFMLHIEALDQQHICEEDLKSIFDYACDKPLFTMNYRRPNKGKTDEQLIAEQLTAVRAGASMIDMMGDMFDPSPLELTRNESAIARQQQIIEDVHALGGEVLMSSHTWAFMTTEELLAHAQALEARGADFVKIAMCAHSEAEMLESLRATALVSKELKVPFLHICMGQHGKLHRAISPVLGSCFALCVQSYKETAHKEKPLLRAEKAVLENLDWKPARNTSLGTYIPPEQR